VLCKPAVWPPQLETTRLLATGVPGTSTGFRHQYRYHQRQPHSYVPVPVSDTLNVPALLLNVSVPFTAPVAVGANVTFAWQVLLAASVAPQLVKLTEKLASPLVEGGVRVIGPTPVLLKNTVSTRDCPTTVFANTRDVGFTLAVWPTPVPLSGTLNVPALVANVSVPLNVPSAVGENVAFTWQVEDAGSVAPQLVKPVEKLASPDVAGGEVSVMGPTPVFWRKTVTTRD
jgi:hypothetical protein